MKILGSATPRPRWSRPWKKRAPWASGCPCGRNGRELTVAIPLNPRASEVGGMPNFLELCPSVRRPRRPRHESDRRRPNTRLFESGSLPRTLKEGGPSRSSPLPSGSSRKFPRRRPGARRIREIRVGRGSREAQSAASPAPPSPERCATDTKSPPCPNHSAPPSSP